MRRFQDRSITVKLSLLVALSGAITLVVACTAFVVNDIVLIRSSAVAQVSTLANVLEFNCTPALDFGDAPTATELLSSLSMQPNIELACLYQTDGALLAHYSNRGEQLPRLPLPTWTGSRFTPEGTLEISQRIAHSDGSLAGSIYLRASMDDLRRQEAKHLVIALAVFGISLVTAFVFARRLQRLITAPILKLAQAMQTVSCQNAYHIRVRKESADELGSLCDGFNAMLEQIERSSSALRLAHGASNSGPPNCTRPASKPRPPIGPRANFWPT